MASKTRQPSPLELYSDLRELSRIASAAASDLHNIVHYVQNRESLDDREAAHFIATARHFMNNSFLPFHKLVEKEGWAFPGNCLERLHRIAGGVMVGIDRATAMIDCRLLDSEVLAVRQSWHVFRDNLQSIEFYSSEAFQLDLTDGLKKEHRRRLVASDVPKPVPDKVATTETTLAAANQKDEKLPSRMFWDHASAQSQKILEFLMKSKDRRVRRDRLIKRIWHDEKRVANTYRQAFVKLNEELVKYARHSGWMVDWHRRQRKADESREVWIEDTKRKRSKNNSEVG